MSVLSEIEAGHEALRGARRLIQTLKDDSAYQKLYAELQEAMTRAWSDAMRSAIIEALAQLEELPTGNFSEQDADDILDTLNAKVGGEAMQGVMRRPLINLTDALYRTGLAEAGQSIGVDTRFGVADRNAVKIVQQGNLFWVGNSWNAYTDKLFRNALTDYFKEGMSRQQVTARFAKDFAGLSERSIHYWEILADHTATRVREIGRVSAYESARVIKVEVRAHIDDGTTQFCRAMHGKVIPIQHIVAQRDAYLKAVSERDMEQAKAVWTMNQEKDAASVQELAGDELPKNIALPPYHFRCRTITVAYFD